MVARSEGILNWHEIVGANVGVSDALKERHRPNWLTLPASTFEAWVASSVARAILP